MCGRIKISGLTVFHGEMVTVLGHKKDQLKWGDNEIFNVRLESLDKTWVKIKSGNAILPVHGFYEKNKVFGLSDGSIFGLAGIYDQLNNFYVLTRPSNPTIKQYHDRMPVPLYVHRFSDYLNDGKMYIENIERFLITE